MSQTEAHPWLKEKVYEPARQRTVHLVQQAVDSLVKRGQRVSLASVIAESTKIDPEGRGISKGGILGNPDAKAYYDRHKSWKVPKQRKNAGNKGQGATPAHRPIDPNRDTARVRNRLARMGKDELADRVLELEQGFAVLEEQWVRLNDDLLHWRLRAQKAEAQLEKLRRALDNKESKVQHLQNKLDDLYAVGSGVADEEVHRVLQETLKRAQKAEEQAKDLRLRLFAKTVVRFRDKVRRLSKKGSTKLQNPVQ